jgi:LPS-assembly protein
VIIKFDNSKFGNKNNQPRLKGNSVYSNKNSTILKKGVFTTCKKRDKCPPWVISAEEIKHNKLKKIINYKNAWPVLYFPKFFHPDPTVKRQSGFLIPTLSNSNNFGLSANIPYYHVISDNKDLTFKPRIYADQTQNY